MKERVTGEASDGSHVCDENEPAGKGVGRMAPDVGAVCGAGWVCSGSGRSPCGWSAEAEGPGLEEGAPGCRKATGRQRGGGSKLNLLIKNKIKENTEANHKKQNKQKKTK